jgi:nicotinate-nucleotide--dimethylbenzimidazole phosphoribosyltransferase
MSLSAPKPNPAVTLEEIARLVRHDMPSVPPMQAEARLGEFAPVRLWLARAQEKQAPTLRHPRLALFLGAYGEDFALDAACATLTPLAEEANADLRVYELAAEAGAFDTAHAIAYGLMAVQPGVDLVAAATLHPKSKTAGEAVIAAIDAGEEPFTALGKHGNADIAAALGCMIAARLAKTAVLAEGTGAKAAIRVLEALRPGSSAHALDAAEILPQKTALPAGAACALAIPFLRALARG